MYNSKKYIINYKSINDNIKIEYLQKYFYEYEY